MKKRRKIITAILLLSCLAASGCGKKEKVLDPENPTAVVVWHYYSGKQKNEFDQLVQEFNDTVGAEKGIIVTVESKGEVNALSTAVLDAAQKKVGAEEMPNVFATYMDTANEIYQMDLLVDISDYMSEEELGEYVPDFLEEGRLAEGELQVLPIAKSTELFYLNKTDWDKFAEETGHTLSELSTWEGIAAAAEDYYEWSGGKVFFGRDAAANYLLVGCHQLGNDIYQEKDGKMIVSMDEAAMRRLWDNYAVPYIKGYYGAFGRFRSDDVKTGDMIACVGSTSSVAYFPQEVTLADGTTYPIEAMVMSLPNFEGTKAAAVQQGAGMAVAKSDEKEETASVEFLKWFTSEEQNTQFCADSGYFPVKAGNSVSESMKKVLEESGIKETDLTYENTVLGTQMIENTELYVPPVMDKGEEYRAAITRSLTEQLEQYHAAYEQLGETEKEAYLEQCFENWINGLREAMAD